MLLIYGVSTPCSTCYGQNKWGCSCSHCSRVASPLIWGLVLGKWRIPAHFRYASIYTKVSSHGREETWKWEDSLSCFLPKHNWSLRSTCILGCLILFSHLNAARSGHSKFRIHRHLPNAWDKCRRLSTCWKTNSSSHLLLYSWLPFLFVFIFFKLQNFLFSHKKNRIILEKWK